MMLTPLATAILAAGAAASELGDYYDYSSYELDLEYPHHDPFGFLDGLPEDQVNIDDMDQDVLYSNHYNHHHHSYSSISSYYSFSSYSSDDHSSHHGRKRHKPLPYELHDIFEDLRYYSSSDETHYDHGYRSSSDSYETDHFKFKSRKDYKKYKEHKPKRVEHGFKEHNVKKVPIKAHAYSNH